VISGPKELSGRHRHPRHLSPRPPRGRSVIQRRRQCHWAPENRPLRGAPNGTRGPPSAGFGLPRSVLIPFAEVEHDPQCQTSFSPPDLADESGTERSVPTFGPEDLEDGVQSGWVSRKDPLQPPRVDMRSTLQRIWRVQTPTTAFSSYGTLIHPHVLVRRIENQPQAPPGNGGASTCSAPPDHHALSQPSPGWFLGRP
jgi:hypothetical protein